MITSTFLEADANKDGVISKEARPVVLHFSTFSVQWRRLQEFKDFVTKASSSPTLLGTQQLV